MQSQRDIREVLVILQREQEDRQNFLMTIENLQLTRVKRSTCARPSSINSDHTIDARTDLIRNFRVQQSVCQNETVT